MRRRYLWFGLASVAVVVAAITLIALPGPAEWTTSSDEALAELEAALDAQSKVYVTEQIRHLERAIELDPGFVLAKLALAEALRRSQWGDERATKLLDEVAAADVESLRPRERFMVRRAIARNEQRYDEAARLLDEYLAEHPDDPFVLQMKASQFFERGDWENAELLYRRLVELTPNWALAYNQLGYITMLQGRFTEAEEYFTSYRFIAPDQANPHDSLGELYIIQGRYEEAETSLERALEIKSDFSASLFHLAQTRMLMADFDGAFQAVERLAGLAEVPKSEVAAWRCIVEAWRLGRQDRWADIVLLADQPCAEHPDAIGPLPTILHRAACKTGDWELATAQEAILQKSLEDARQRGISWAVDMAWPTSLHMEGVRSAVLGDLATAEQRFREADEHLAYRESGVGVFKLINRLLLVETLLARGREGEAHALLAKVRAVNPALVASFQERGNQALGLERG